MTLMILGTVFGSVIIIAVFFPYFLIAVAVILFGTSRLTRLRYSKVVF